jgi:hypothetical protein
VVVIPNLIFVGSMLMLLAALTRSMLMVYLGVIGFFVLWSFAGYLTKDINNDSSRRWSIRSGCARWRA